MSVISSKHIIGAIALFAIIWLLPAVAQASGPVITITAPASLSAGSSTPVYFLVQSSGVPVTGAAVTVTASGGSVSPATATTNASGYAMVTFQAPTTTGSRILNVTCNGATATQSVSIVSGPPQSLEIIPAQTLLPADGYSKYTLKAKTRDIYGNPCEGWPVNVTVDGSLTVVTAGPDGNATLLIGPRSSSYTYTVTAEANGHSGDVTVRYLLVNLYLLNYPSSITVGQNVSLTAMLLDDLTPAPGIQLNFTVYSPGSLATPSFYSGMTDQSGKVVFTFRTSTSTGMNTVIVNNQSLGGDLRSASIRGTSGLVSKIILGSNPAMPIYADGVTGYTLKIWTKDSGGNPVKNEELTVVRNLIENYTVTTNTNGYAEIDVGSSQYVGVVRFDVYAASGVTSNTTLSYIAGPPAAVKVKAVPNVIASSEVVQPQDMTDIHATEVIVQVVDLWYHPLPDCSVNVTSSNTTAGTITGGSAGITDANGEFYTTFRLGNFSNGTGTVNVGANSGTLSSSCQITYTNCSFLSVDTTVSPRNVTVNDTINVQVSIRGIGWNNRPQAVDMMLITDRSGSMDWYSNMVYPTNGQPKTGTLPQAGTSYLVATFDNTQTQYSTLQFMLSSPFTNYANGSYYRNVYVVDSRGNYYTTNSGSQNENIIKITDAKARKYNVYAEFRYNAAGGTPPYSLAVLSKPYRLGSSYDLDSAAKVAARQLIDNMTSIDQLGLASFNTAGTLDSMLRVVNSTNKTTLKNTINGMDANGGTNIYTGIQKAEQEFDAHGRSNAKHVVILLTDGYSQSPANDIIEAYNAKNKGIIIFTLGMGMADAVTLGSIANITGGTFYQVASDLELAERYQQIFKNVSEVIANSSSMDIMSARSVVNGTLMDDAKYVPYSAIVTNTNGTTEQVEPVVSIDNNNYTLSWNPGSININQLWQVRYSLKVMHGGVLTPITGNSTVAYTRSDGSNGSVNFVSDSIYCRGAVGGSVTNPSPLLSVSVNSPANGTTIDQLRTMIGWTVFYTGTGTYNQRISVFAEDGTEWADIAKGFTGDRSTAGSFSYWWNLERVPTGNYTVQVYVTDGTYDAEDHVMISIPYKSGKIVLQ